MGQRRSIEGSRILVTGASQGIGKALVEIAVRRGAHVLAVARSEDLLHELAEQMHKVGGSFEVLNADVTSPIDRQRMVAAAEKHFGGLDLLVNNAGIGATGHFAEGNPNYLRRIMEV